MRTEPFASMDEVNEYLGGETIECLECGKHFRMLTGKHLRLLHGMTPDEYRERWGLPWTAPLAGQATRRARSEIARAMIAEGKLTYDHLPRAAAAARETRLDRDKAPVAKAAHAEIVRKIRPGDHGLLPPGAKRADGRDADRAREYQRAYRRWPSPTPEQWRELRQRAGLTQAQAGELVFSPRRTVEDWEAGKRRIPPMAWELLRIKLSESA